MIRLLLPILALCAIAPGAAATEGALRTLATGVYACELPGDATGPVGRRVAEEDFTVVNASNYRARGKRGSYLMTGNRVVMTSGPLRGQRYLRMSDRVLRAVGADGAVQPLRCIRSRNPDF